MKQFKDYKLEDILDSSLFEQISMKDKADKDQKKTFAGFYRVVSSDVNLDNCKPCEGVLTNELYLVPSVSIKKH